MPEDNPELFIAVDSFESDEGKEQLLKAAKDRWQKRKAAENDMALLFYTLLDRLRLRAEGLVEGDVIAIRNADIDAFDAAYVLERVSRSSACGGDVVLLVEARDSVVRLARRQVSYLDDYPSHLRGREYPFERETMYVNY